MHAAVDALTTSIQPDLVLITGDMVAGQQAGLDYAAMWAGFHSAVTDRLSTAGIPLAPTPGNHDASGYSAFANERMEYAWQWNQTARVPAVTFIDDSEYPLRYSFEYAGAFFISLDATTVGPISEQQRDWVAQQLAGASAYTVKIAYGHVPLHPVAIGRETEVLGDDALEQLLSQHGLTMFISGHHHAYYPGAAGGIRQVAMPCAGSGSRQWIGTSTTSNRGALVVDFVDGAVTTLEMVDSSDYATIVERSTLPASISYDSHLLTRDDLAGF